MEYTLVKWILFCSAYFFPKTSSNSTKTLKNNLSLQHLFSTPNTRHLKLFCLLTLLILSSLALNIHTVKTLSSLSLVGENLYCLDFNEPTFLFYFEIELETTGPGDNPHYKYNVRNVFYLIVKIPYITHRARHITPETISLTEKDYILQKLQKILISSKYDPRFVICSACQENGKIMKKSLIFSVEKQLSEDHVETHVSMLENELHNYIVPDEKLLIEILTNSIKVEFGTEESMLYLDNAEGNTLKLSSLFSIPLQLTYNPSEYPFFKGPIEMTFPKTPTDLLPEVITIEGEISDGILKNILKQANIHCKDSSLKNLALVYQGNDNFEDFLGNIKEDTKAFNTINEKLESAVKVAGVDSMECEQSWTFQTQSQLKNTTGYNVSMTIYKKEGGREEEQVMEFSRHIWDSTQEIFSEDKAKTNIFQTIKSKPKICLFTTFILAISFTIFFAIFYWILI